MSKAARRIAERLLDMQQAIGHIQSDLGDLQRDDFLCDGKTQRAVVESMIVIGEAAHSIVRADPALEHTHPELWLQLREAYGMRIILTHEYFRIDAALVWDTIQNDLPKLEGLLKAISLSAGGTSGK